MATSYLGRVLIVDDEVELMTALCETLTDQGYEVVGMASASEALTFLREQDVDLLISDLMMPEMDGIAMLRAALDLDPYLVGIIMTGQGTIQTAIDAMRMGAFDYILKPFKLQALLPVLGRALQVRQLRLENVQLRETVALYELGQAMAYTLDVNTVLHKVIDGAMQQVDGDEASIMLPTPDAKEFYIAAVRGKDREALLGKRVSIKDSVTGWVARHREPLTLHGAMSDQRFASPQTREEITTITLPMLAGGKLVGVLSVNGLRRHRTFVLGQVKALSILANLAATAVENASLYAQVRQSEERFRSVAESAADAIISADSRGMILSWNHSAETLFGYTQDEVVGQPLTFLLPERYREACMNGFNRAVLTAHQRLFGRTIEVYGLTKAGTELPVELSLSNWQTNKGLFFSAIIRDITERKRAEEALRQSEARYRALVEGSLQGIAILSLDGTHLFANTALAQMFGYDTPEDLVGKTLWDQVAPHEVTRLRAALDVPHQGAPAPVRHEYQTMQKDETLIWVECLASPIMWDGTPAILGAYIDITERKRLETQLRQAQKMEAIGTLAGGIAHDFNNILAAILGYAELITQELEPDCVAWRDVQGVLTAGYRAKDLVQQILAFSRRTDAERLSIHLHPLVKEALTLLRAALPSTIAIEPAIDTKAGSVLVDPTQIHQVVLNLCINAAHAMHETGGVIAVRLEAVDVSANGSAPAPDLQVGRYVRLTVRDTGYGMTPEVMERIFEPFFTTKNLGEGTGMGLAVVHGIVASHGGAISVQSTPGQGTMFAVYLPRSDRPASSVPVTTEEPVIGGHERILFVDDEDSLVHLGKAHLERQGYNVVVCTSSPEALETFRATPHCFDLVITDRTMPKMTGETLIRELRHIRPDVPIILCTGFSRVMTAEQTRALGIDAIILKPVAAQDWSRVIREVLAQRAATKT